MGIQESRYVNCFCQRFPGRIAIGVGYSQEMVELFPIVIEDDQLATFLRDYTQRVFKFTLNLFDFDGYQANQCRQKRSL